MVWFDYEQPRHRALRSAIATRTSHVWRSRSASLMASMRARHSFHPSPGSTRSVSALSVRIARSPTRETKVRNIAGEETGDLRSSMAESHGVSSESPLSADYARRSRMQWHRPSIADDGSRRGAAHTSRVAKYVPTDLPRPLPSGPDSERSVALRLRRNSYSYREPLTTRST